MKIEYPFLVELGKEGDGTRKYEQHLFCRCGHKQKVKIGLKRILLKNAENVYEDKYDVESVSCTQCGELFSVLNNLIGIKEGHNVLGEISFNSDTLNLGHKTIWNLKRNKKYFHYVYSEDAIKSFIITDIITYDSMTGQISLFLNSSNEEKNIGEDIESSSSKPNIDEIALSKNTKLEVFDICDSKVLESFFSYDGSINYIDIEVAFDFIDMLFSKSYDYETLSKEKFFSDFKISKHIISEKINNKEVKYVMRKDMFGGSSLVKKKLDSGDYMNRLQKFAELCFVFIYYPSISTLYKQKGITYIYNSYKGGFLASKNILEYNKATNPLKIVETCCKNFYYKNETKKSLAPISSLSIEVKENNITEPEDDFKLSPLLFKAIMEPEDAMIIYKFNKKKSISKAEMETLFQRFNSKDVLEVMSKVSSTYNMRNVVLDMRYLNHILKNKFFKESNGDWLGIYLDTINTLRLIVDIINTRKEQGKSLSGLAKLEKVSDEKLLEIKKYDKLKILHDEMAAVYRAMEDEGKDLKYRTIVKQYSNINNKMNMFDFKVIPNLNELSKEGLVMHHCIYTYLNDIADGGYLAVRVKDLISKERATMGLKVVEGKIYLQQLKGYYNSRPTSLLIDTVLTYCEKMNIITTGNREENHYLHSNDIQPNKTLEKRMKEYLEPEEAERLRKKAMSKK